VQEKRREEEEENKCRGRGGRAAGPEGWREKEGKLSRVEFRVQGFEGRV